ncbi:class II aldolase/adducin N-terminal [Hysterangium stoloniferum]|nr:class II aldolase/adducin N-terminal [Hysterangium stoloniferum]
MAPVATTQVVQTVESLKKPHQALENLPQNPLERVWRGNKSGTVRLDDIPDFKGDKYAERQWIKEHMAAAFRFWGKMGYAEGAAGHITVRDPVKPGHYWMNPICVHYSSMKASHLVLVDPEGYVTEDGAQLPINAAGFYIHSAIHEARPDVQAAAHCHSIHARAWSVFGKPIDMLTQDSTIFYNNLSVYANFGGVVLAHEEGARIAKAIGPKNKAVLLQNHGALTLGNTVDEAMHLFRGLENACQVQLMVEAAAANGIPKQIIDDADAAYSNATLADAAVSYAGFMPEYSALVEETNGAFLK